MSSSTFTLSTSQLLAQHSSTPQNLRESEGPGGTGNLACQPANQVAADWIITFLFIYFFSRWPAPHISQPVPMGSGSQRGRERSRRRIHHFGWISVCVASGGTVSLRGPTCPGRQMARCVVTRPSQSWVRSGCRRWECDPLTRSTLPSRPPPAPHTLFPLGSSEDGRDGRQRSSELSSPSCPIISYLSLLNPLTSCRLQSGPGV